MLCLARSFLRPVLGAALLSCMLCPAAFAEALKAGGTGAALGTIRLLAAEFERSSPGDTLAIIPGLGTGGGAKALAAGAIHFAALARPLTQEETAQGLVAVEYGRTPFVIATSATGTGAVNSTTELVSLYSGARPTWASGTPVRLVLRPLRDSDSEQLAAVVPELKALLPGILAKPGMIVAPSDQDAAEAIEKTPGGIGTSTLALIRTERREVRLLPIHGVMPSTKALADGSYPHFKTMYLARSATASPAVVRFFDFLATPRARQIIADAGHVPAASRDGR